MIQGEGIIDESNYSAVFRNIAQKRQNGWLMLSGPNGEQYIGFHNGKIIDVGNAKNRRGLEQLIDNLVEAAILKSRIDVKELSTFEELFKVFINNKSLLNIEVSESLMKALVRELVLDTLFNLEFSGSYRMTGEIISHDRYFNPFITVGQYLLDKVVFDNEEWNFTKLFPGDCFVKRTAKVPEMLTDEERRIFNVVRLPTSVPEIKKLALLSAFTIRESLLSMHKANLVEAVSGSAHTNLNEESVLDDPNDKEYFDLLANEPVNLTNITAQQSTLEDFIDEELPDNIARLIQDTSLGSGNFLSEDYDIFDEEAVATYDSDKAHEENSKVKSQSNKKEKKKDLPSTPNTVKEEIRTNSDSDNLTFTSSGATINPEIKKNPKNTIPRDKKAVTFDQDLFDNDTSEEPEFSEINDSLSVRAILPGQKKSSWYIEHSLNIYLIAITVALLAMPLVRFLK